MEKITVRAVTRLQKFLAAIAGDGVAPDPITDKEKLLHNIAENVNNGGGSGGGVLVVHDVEGTLDKTWQEIKDADFAVVKILGEYGYDSGCVTSVGKFLTNYDVQAFEWGQDPQTLEPVASVKTYRASSEDGYPTISN